MAAGGDAVLELRPKKPPTFCSKDWKEGDDLKEGIIENGKYERRILHLGEFAGNGLTKIRQGLASNIANSVEFC